MERKKEVTGFARLVFLVAGGLASAFAPAATLSQVIVRQQWPWSTDVKVEFLLAGAAKDRPVDIRVTALNGETPLPAENLAAAITGDIYGLDEDGVHSFTIDPVAAFGTAQVALANFYVRLEAVASDANINEVLYKIVDLTPPYAVTDVRRKDFYNGKYGDYVTSFSAIDAEFSTSLTNVLIWTGVAKDDIYRTDKMVFRRIPAAGESFMMFTNNAAENVNGRAGVKVSFTNDFYIGVFEVTQAQVAHFYSSWSANETNALYAATRAASCAKLCGYNAALRSGSNANTVWPEDLSHTVSQVNSCLMGNMQKKTKLLIDLPTEAMWEFACRAGTTTRLYTGHAAKVPKYNDSHTKKIMRVVDVNGQGSTSVPGRNCDLSVGPNKPGCYKPNAFGLYDMYGNLWEWCLDRYTPAGKLPGGVEPPGPAGADVSEPAKHVLRGGSYRWNASYVEDRLDRSYSYGTEDHGARLCIWLTGNPEGTL